MITTAGKLSAQYVIHTVGPVWKGGRREEEKLLRSCYQRSLALAVENHCKSIAFPNISTGIYGYPKEDAARISVKAIQEFPDLGKIEKVGLVCFDEENYRYLEKILSLS